MKGKKVSWRVLSGTHWTRDSLLYVRVSNLANSMLNTGCSLHQVESVLQDLGMNITDDQLFLILKRAAK